MRRLLLLAALLAPLAGCDGPITDPCVEDPASCEPPGPEVIAGVNMSALLRPPSVADLAAARALWGQGAPTGYVGRLAMTQTLADGTRLYVLEGRDTFADTVATYGLARVPPVSGSSPLPVVLIAPNGVDVTSADLLTRAADDPLQREWVQVVAMPRGGTVTLGGVTYTSPAASSPYALDVDDALGLIDAARGSVPRARGAVAAYGRGRGGAVALLASERDSRIAAVATLAAPSDLFIEDVPDAFRNTLRGNPSGNPIPGAAAVARDVIVPLRDGLITLDQARAELFARSPVRFIETVAPTVALHGSEDSVVDVIHGRRLQTALRSVATTPGSYIETTDSHASLFTSFGVRNEAATHIDDVVR